MRWLVADWEGNKGHVFKDVLQGLLALGHSIQIIPRSDMSRRKELCRAIVSGNFDAMLTWQRIFRMQDDLLAAVAASSIKTIYMDFGFIPHYRTVVFDSDGENAVSSWPSFWAQGGPSDLTQCDLDAAEELMRSEAARARLLTLPPEPELEEIGSTFIFVPLQRPGDSVVKFDSTVHKFDELLLRVILLARGSHNVVAKLHPLDRNLNFGVLGSAGAGNHIIRHSYGDRNESVCDYLLSQASLVVGINSNMLFRAVLFGTPTNATGRGWYTGSGVLREVQGVNDLTSLTVPPRNIDAQRRYIASSLARQLHFKDLSNPRKLSAVLCRVGKFSESERARLASAG